MVHALSPRQSSPSSGASHRWRRALVVTVTSLGLLVVPGVAASATTSVTLYVSQSGTVTTGCTSSGTGACETIAEGVAAATALSGDDVTIEVAASVTSYDETLDITDTANPALTINGAGAGSTTIDNAGSGCVVTNENATLTLSNLTISDGDGSTGGGGVCNNYIVYLTDDTLSHDAGSYGGGLNNNYEATLSGDTFSHDTSTNGGGAIYSSNGLDEASITVADSTLSDNSAYQGGAIYSYGSFSLTDDTVSANTASQGGAVYNTAYGLITGSTLSSNTATQSGGGAYNTYRLTITNDTFSDNSATDNGGGVDAAGEVTLSNTTFSGNSAANGGGVSNNAVSTYTNATFVDNSATGNGGGLDDESRATVTDDTFEGDTAATAPGLYDENTAIVGNSIFDNAGCAKAVGATFTDDGYNVETGTSCAFGPSSLENATAINLATTLAANGSTGPQTLALGAGSVAIDIVPKAACTVVTDERGDKRPGATGQSSCDAGAYELQSVAFTAPQKFAAKAGNALITFTWSPPASSGGSPVTGYKLYCSTSKSVAAKGKPTATTKASVHTDKVTKLKNKTKYYCVIVATNAHGTSPASSVASATPKA